MGSRDQTQVVVVRLAGKLLYPLNHLAGPLMAVLKQGLSALSDGLSGVKGRWQKMLGQLVFRTFAESLSSFLTQV